jgi:hypothetical protein
VTPSYWIKEIPLSLVLLLLNLGKEETRFLFCALRERGFKKEMPDASDSAESLAS